MTAIHAADRRLVDPDTAAAHGLRRISWGGVFAGVAVALAGNLVLNLLGVGIGAASLNPAGDGAASAAAVSMGAAAWWMGSGVVAAFAGGAVAARLAGPERRASGGWHGLTTWAMTTLIVFYLLTSAAGSVLGGVYGAVGGALSAAGGATAGAARTAVTAAAGLDDPFAAIEQQVREASGGQDPAALRDTAIATLKAAVTGGEADAAEARQRAAQALAAARQIPIDQASADVQRYEQQYRAAVETAKQQASEAAAATASAVSKGSLLAALSLVVGALAGWIGGAIGARRAV